MSAQLEELRALGGRAWPELTAEQLSRVEQYFDVLQKGNELQNLTRLVGPSDFVEGHLVDVRELHKCGFLAGKCMDLGSGGGVPGLLSLAVDPSREWVLAESEGHKAEFLREAVGSLGLSAEIFGGRAEEYLRSKRVDAIVARAVGPVERIMGWIGRCSTWNTLVLLKGPGWEAEWAAFQESRHRGSLEQAGEHRYVVGEEQKKRVIVRLKRLKK